VSLGWQTIESALPGWKATHEGVRVAAPGGEAPVDDGYVPAVLASERSAVTACLERLAAGVSARALLVAAREPRRSGPVASMIRGKIESTRR